MPKILSTSLFASGQSWPYKGRERDWANPRPLALVGTHPVRTRGPSTFVAKLLSALAGHGRAPIVPLDPVVALGTLFELGSSHKVYEFLVVLVEGVAHTVLRAGHPVMVVALAAEAVVF